MKPLSCPCPEVRGEDTRVVGKKPSESAVRYSGQDGLLAMIAETDAEIVVNGITGAVGLLPSREALRSGKDLALANKENNGARGVSHHGTRS
jgi:1-deoxy-D-xylulose 5-phosphate reductoisomerase